MIIRSPKSLSLQLSPEMTVFHTAPALLACNGFPDRHLIYYELI